MKFQDSVAVVTGGASGIGRAAAIEFARAGCDVLVADIDEGGGADTARAVSLAGRSGRFLFTDVGSRESVEALVSESIAWRGHCDLFLSNAAIFGLGAPHEFSVEDWESILDTDLLASVWAVRALLPHMLECNSGHISLVSSGAGLRGIPTMAPYSVAKFGLIGLAESLAMYLKGAGVSVSVVVPGAVSGTRSSLNNVRIAGEGRMAPGEADGIRKAQRDMAATWPSPESMAKTIVEGIAAGRFYIFQDGQGQYEDWALKEMQQKWRDPDAFVLRQ